MALLASSEKPNCTEGKAGGDRGEWMVVGEHLDRKPQNCQIQTAKVNESVQNGIDLGL